MTTKNKKIYEDALIEVLQISAADVISTSVLDEYVDKDENSWVTPGVGGFGDWN